MNGAQAYQINEQQKFAVLCILDDDDDLNEFAFLVLAFCGSEQEADVYIRNVASPKVKDHAMFILNTGRWYSPANRETEGMKINYRNNELQKLMDTQKQCKDNLENMCDLD